MATNHSSSDTHTRGGVEIRWRDYQTPANQVVLIGFWWAFLPNVPPRERLLTYSTTLGYVDTIDITGTVIAAVQPGWPIMLNDATSEELQATKTRALEALYAALDAPREPL